jgi:hypothetical protein
MEIMPQDRQMEVARAALRLIGERCPRLKRTCYWAGTAAVAIEELHHRRSFDLDFHTRHALANVSPLLAELQSAFPGAFELVQAPDAFGSGFRGVLALPGGEKLAIEVLSNFEDVPADDLVESRVASGMQRVTVSRYLADQIQCVAERTEARDLVDVMAVLRQYPALEGDARRLLGEQDAALVAERLLAWTDDQIEEDLAAYDDVSPGDARQARDLLLDWLKDDARG